ncbi:MAG: OmpA family protein [Candidatus Omnitrophota bacterium]
MTKLSSKRGIVVLVVAFLCASFCYSARCFAKNKDARGGDDLQAVQEQFTWWPTDAKPTPVKDQDRGGYWWWPTEPGSVGPLWGNRGYIYVYKIIYDYKAEELPPAKPQELRPSLIIKKIIKNVKIYFDYNKSDIRQDAAEILQNAAKTLKRNEQADILVTGNCDTRGSEAYNEKLGRRRADSVKQFMLNQGVAEDRIRIISRGKLGAVAPITDLLGMQKDRNAQFMIAEVEEVMIPAPGQLPADATIIEEDKPMVEEETIVESESKVTTKEYVVQKNDSLWKIAQKELGGGHRWKTLYELNKDKIKNPNKLKVGTKLTIPVE